MLETQTIAELDESGHQVLKYGGKKDLLRQLAPNETKASEIIRKFINVAIKIIYFIAYDLLFTAGNCSHACSRVNVACEGGI